MNDALETADETVPVIDEAVPDISEPMPLLEGMRRLPKGALLLDDGRVEYTLAKPIAYQEGNTPQKLEAIIIRRGNVEDKLAIKKLDNAIDIAFVTVRRRTGLANVLVRQIDDFDFEAIGEVIDFLQTHGPRTPTSA